MQQPPHRYATVAKSHTDSGMAVSLMHNLSIALTITQPSYSRHQHKLKTNQIIV